MADENMGPSTEWQKVRRVYRVARFAPRIHIRRNGTIAISADFVRMADIEACTRASLFLSADGLRLALRFHNDERDDDAFTLGRDGGGKGSGKGRLIAAAALLAQSSVIAGLARESAEARRYEPTRDRDGKWVVNLAPCFDRVLGDERPAANSTGIYRYRLGEETIYIGRGRLTERFSDVARRDWQFDRVEYSVLNDEAAERRWEAHWLNEYRQRNGRWPFYNRVAGAAPAAAAKAG